MADIEIRLLGGFSALADQQPITGLSSRRAQELFSFLLLERERRHVRESLADLLWGDGPADQARKVLRQALWHVQSALDVHLANVPAVRLSVDADWICLHAEHGIRLDVATIEDAFRQVQGVSGADLTESTFALVRDAVSLYRGDLLANWYADWCITRRERLQAIFLELLDKLVVYCETHGRYEAGVAYASEILRYDRACERAHRRLMRLYYLSGNRTAALRQFARCVDVLRQELDVDPGHSTVRLVEHIRADRFDDAPDESGPSRSPRRDVGSTEADALASLRATLNGIREHVQQDLIALDRVLDGFP